MLYDSLALNRMVDDITVNKHIEVSKEQYERFKKQWIFDAISGLRYGQAFCKYFGIANSTPLYFFKDNSVSERWIKDHYLM